MPPKKDWQLDSARFQAQARGEKFYTSLLPCLKAHVSERYVSTRQCVQCHAEWTLAKDADSEKTRKRELQRRRRSNPVTREAERLRNRTVNREQRRLYQNAHPEKEVAKQARRRARKRGAFVENVTLEYLIQRDGGKCQLCGGRVVLSARHPHGDSPSMDHIVPLAKGGKHERKNMQLAHFRCNSRKGARSMDEQLLLVG